VQGEVLGSMQFQERNLFSSSPLREEVAPLRNMMSTLDITRVKAWEIAEREKNEAFAFLKIFHKPAPEAIECVKFIRYYEPFLKLTGIYSVTYWRKKIYIIQVDHNVVEAKIFGNTVKPRTVEADERKIISLHKPSADRIIDLEASELVKNEDTQTIIVDREGKELLEPLPPTDTIEITDSYFKEYQNEFILSEAILSIKPKAINMLKDKIVKKPGDAEIIVDEMIKITEMNVIYFPYYYAEYNWKEKNEKRAVKIDGSTGKVKIYTPP
jgi:hypothetical protein